ncbi:uncharacterized protein C8A04DRAFT_15069 [Dichotomopilus funicola]|uniref:Uncharacterized protein n=1 Tax=Dichotomopilus funicola TaxID=1934379 RepID=A0AAN6ZK41_9PEZI|nr:hypothetical protein C8A04DRAFT_15069 [Dichotomopilus funicola]
MLSEKERRQYQVLAENAALLYQLRPSPTARHVNKRPAWAVNQDPSRFLSFDQELDLTSALAFICGVSDNPLHVVATCVEEITGRGRQKGIRAVVAINGNNPQSSIGTSTKVKDGLEAVFMQLSRVHQVDLLEYSVLRAIVDMCKHRIFSRIGSERQDAKYTKNGKQFLGTTLQCILDAISTTRRSFVGELKGIADRFARQGRQILHHLKSLETCKEKNVVSIMMDVIRAVHKLIETTSFNILLDTLTTTELAPTDRHRFTTQIAKLAQYQECTLLFLQMAKAQNIFQQAEVHLVSLEPELFKPEMPSPPGCHITSCINRCRASSGSKIKANTTEITAKLQRQGKFNTAFKSTVHEILKQSRVHAEIQLLTHYELHPVPKKPRIICSSKDSCYLCNLFIRLRGDFYTPRTHGNIYHRWWLPPVPEFAITRNRLNQELEAQIGRVTLDFMSPGSPGLMLAKNENESTVFAFSELSSTADSLMEDTPASSSNKRDEPNWLNRHRYNTWATTSPHYFPTTAAAAPPYLDTEVYSTRFQDSYDALPGFAAESTNWHRKDPFVSNRPEVSKEEGGFWAGVRNCWLFLTGQR